MALLDIFKKNELNEISILKDEIINLKNSLEESNSQCSALNTKYSGIIDIEIEQEKLSKNFDNLNIRYKKAFDLYQGLIKETLQLISKKKFADYGIYEPIFDFDHSSKYREKISENLAEQKELIKSNKAVICTTQWTVDGSIVKGRVMTKKNIKILLMAFNGECDSQIEKARWNNCQLIAERLDSIYYSTPVLSDHRGSFFSLVRSHCKPLFVSGLGSVKADLQVACHSLDGFRSRRYLCLEWKRAMQHIRTIQRAVFRPNYCGAVGCCNS